MPRHLSQFIAIKAETQAIYTKALDTTRNIFKSAGKFSGLSRSYRPKEDQGEQLPSESTKVQLKAPDLLQYFQDVLQQYIDVVGTVDYGNMAARAHVIVDGETIIANAPAPFLLWLEKQINIWRDFVREIPKLNEERTWHWDENQDAFASEAEETTRTQKEVVPVVLYHATPQHPAIVEKATADKLVGYWRTVHFSGALPAKQISDCLNRLDKLQKAVIFAREEANRMDVEISHIGEQLCKYVFAGMTKSS